jgi:septum site-determining protein MinC
MSQAPSVAFAGSTGDSHTEAPAGAPVDVPANVSLRGTTRGLEILVTGTPTAAALGARLTELLAEAPGFFAGSNARVAIDGALPVGALACLEQVAAQFELRLVEIGPVAARRLRGELAAVPGTTPALPPIPPLPAASAAPAPAAVAAADAPGDEVLQPGLAEGTGRVREGRTGVLAAAAAAAAVAAAGTPDADDAAGKAATATAGDAAGTAASGSVLADSAAAAIALLSGAAATTAERAGSAAAMGDAPGSAAAMGDAPGSAAAMGDAPGSAAATGGAAGTAASLAGALPELELLAALAAVLVQAGASERVAAEAAAAAEAASAEPEVAPDEPPGPRLVIGPVRSGRIVDHVGHLIVVGDVNPGAEVRAEGSIIVLGRLRGVAHAAIGRNTGCIIALSLAPQQLRIGRMVARAGDADRPSGGAEIAYATGETIVVERFLGRLPSGLAASM